jgi:DNA-binding PadR family transcriptional regulator
MSGQDPAADRPTPLTYQILLALADRSRHGYGIIKEIEDRGGEGAAPSTGALYLALQRMEGDGLIEEAEAPDEDADARRRYYRMTRKGRETAELESARLVELVDAARSKRLLPEAGG